MDQSWPKEPPREATRANSRTPISSILKGRIHSLAAPERERASSEPQVLFVFLLLGVSSHAVAGREGSASRFWRPRKPSSLHVRDIRKNKDHLSSGLYQPGSPADECRSLRIFNSPPWRKNEKQDRYANSSGCNLCGI